MVRQRDVMPLSRRRLLQSSAALLVGSTVGAGEMTHPAETPRVVRLNYNESPFGPSPRARQALLALGDDASRYAYDEVSELQSLLAEHEGVRPENVFVGEGSGEILKIAALLYGEPGRQILATRPTFTMLPQYASRRGASVEWVDVNEHYGHDFDALDRAMSDATSLVYVCNPNNPTGTLAAPHELRAFIKHASARALVVVDEVYIDFAPDPARATVIDLVKAGANILVTRSFSKIYGLAGLRVGYAVGAPALIRRLESLRISIPNQAGVAAARASHGDAAFCAEIRQRIGASIEFCGRLFDELHLRYAPTAANFMMFDTGQDAAEFVEFARERGVMVAPIYEPLTSWVRVSMGRLDDMKVFASVLRTWVADA
jgi:histidinol-phosphate aminotransferase